LSNLRFRFAACFFDSDKPDFCAPIPIAEELAGVINKQFVVQHISKLPDKPVFNPFTSPGCFAEEREARLHRWIEPKTTDRDAAPHFIPAILLNKLIEDLDSGTFMPLFPVRG
jgi:hypothetical protein